MKTDVAELPVRAQLLLVKAGTAAQIIRILMRDWDGKTPVPTNWFPTEVLTVNASSDARSFKSLIGATGRDPADNALMVGALGAAIRFVATPERWGRIDALAAALRLRSEMSGLEAACVVDEANPTDLDRLMASKLIAVQAIRELL